MSHNLTTLRGTPTYAAGKIGNAMSGGVLGTTDNLNTTLGTLECWVQTTSTSGIKVAVGNPGTGGGSIWIGVSSGVPASGLPGTAGAGGGTTIADGAWHHLAMTIDGTNCTMWVDGVLRQAVAYTGTFNLGNGVAGTTGVGGYGSLTTFDWPGAVDEVRISNNVRYTGTFTPQTTPFASDASTAALYHLEADGTDSATAGGDTTAPTAPTTVSATAGNASAVVTFSGATDNVAVTSYRVYSSADSYTTPVATGSVSPITVTGLTNGTAYTFKVSAGDAAGNWSPQSAATTSVTPTAPSTATIAPNDANIFYSPYTWLVTPSKAQTVNAGAYFKVLITGTPTAITLNFDTTSVVTPLPQVTVTVDGISMFTGPIATTVTVPIPSGTAWTKHLVKVAVKALSTAAARFTPQNTTVKFTGITTTPGTCTTEAVIPRPLNVLFYGDSITEGIRTLNNTATNDTDQNDATVGWAYHSGDLLGAEVGVVGFGGQTYNFLTTSWDFLWSGQARSFSPAPDVIVINYGYNDGAVDITADATTVINGLLGATPSTTKIMLLRPFNNNDLTMLQAAQAGCATPSRVSVVDTANWWLPADASDNLHPYGYTNLTKIAPKVAAAVRPLLPGGSGGGSGRYVNVGGVAKLVGTIVKA